MPLFQYQNRCLHYLQQGEGEAVLLLHGLGSCAEHWWLQMQALSADYQVIAADFRGHGQSSPSAQPFTMQQLAADMLALLTHLEIKRCQVVGFSLGGMVAFELALLAPQCVQSLVIINSGPYLAIQGWRLKLQLGFRLAVIRLLGMRKLGQIIGAKLFPDEEQKPLLELFAQQMASMDQASYRHTLNAIAHFSVQSQLSHLQLPVLVIAADQDYSPVATKAAYVSLLPDAALIVIPNSRHATPLDQPEALNQQLLTFLAKVVKPGLSVTDNTQVSGGDQHV
ncbi:3-oxoadipate enol-lactonase [Alishewanella longhuensis]|uniref:3-oxoadipate enol-lactonase n=1 Tax=Alishewanella longhuensis TaxID=1091037 RepID=A0ABQ3KT72_9ALTE|nr:alpha/beta hydrolase [Alishewanella longhuensis]GHG59431.1 3-oxoadipate enol-lactonase [Alishewanella longhuensis]